MNSLPEERQQALLAMLQGQRYLSIDALSQHFGVSVMTIHRDIDSLTQAGRVLKVRGGVTLAAEKPASTDPEGEACALCRKPINPRTVFSIEPEHGPAIRLCCPHCGLLMLNRQPEAAFVLAREFLYGQMVNAFTAAFLLEPDLRLCCRPTLLCFATAEDAERFQMGFGGQVLALEPAREHLAATHRPRA